MNDAVLIDIYFFYRNYKVYVLPYSVQKMLINVCSIWNNHKIAIRNKYRLQMIDYCPAVYLIYYNKFKVRDKIISCKKKKKKSYIHKIVFDICHFWNYGYAPGVTKY